MPTYRGPDRRRSGEPTGTATFGPVYVAVLTGLVVLVAAALVVAGPSTSGSRQLQVADLFALSTTSLALLAAFLQAARWRVTRVTSALWAAAAGVLGAAIVAGRQLAPSVRWAIDPHTVGSATLAAAVVLAIVVAWIALGPEIDLRYGTWAVMASLTGAVLGLTAVLDGLDLELRNRFAVAPGGGGRLLLAGAWAIGGLLLTLRGGRGRQITPVWVGVFAFSLAAAEVVTAVQIGDAQLIGPGRAALVTLGAVALAHGGDVDLRFALAQRKNELDDTRAQMHAARDRAHDAREAAAERAHEARNALAAIGGAIQTLEKYQDSLPEETKEHLAASMRSEIVRLQRLVDIDDKLDVPDVIRLDDILADTTVQASDQGLQVERDIAPGIEAYASRGAVVEVVQNLLGNARRHTRGEGVKVQLRAVGDRAVVGVLDRGPGVPPDRRAAVFQRGRPTDDTDGSSFGLYLSRRLVAAQGGTLVVLDRPGGGAIFEFDLPLAPSVRPGRRPPVDQVENVDEASHAGRR